MSVGARLHLNPLLIRLVLGATFVYLGTLKWFPQTFEGEAASRLVRMGVVQATQVPPGTGSGDTALPAPSPDPEAPETPGDARLSPGEGGPGSSLSGVFAASAVSALAHPEAEEEATPPGQPPIDEEAEGPPPVTQDENDDFISAPGEPDPTDDAPVTTPPDEPAADDDDPAIAPPPGPGVAAAPLPETGPVEARKLFGIAVMLDKAGHPYPVALAWIAFLTEVIGGLLVILGFFTRIWALGLAIAMGYAFYLTTWTGINTMAFTMASGAAATPLDFLRGFHGLEFGDRITFFLQLALAVMALCLTFGGAGAVSIDRFIFGQPRGERRLHGHHTVEVD